MFAVGVEQASRGREPKAFLAALPAAIYPGSTNGLQANLIARYGAKTTWPLGEKIALRGTKASFLAHLRVSVSRRLPRRKSRPTDVTGVGNGQGHSVRRKLNRRIPREAAYACVESHSSFSCSRHRGSVELGAPDPSKTGVGSDCGKTLSIRRNRPGMPRDLGKPGIPYHRPSPSGFLEDARGISTVQLPRCRIPED